MMQIVDIFHYFDHYNNYLYLFRVLYVVNNTRVYEYKIVKAYIRGYIIAITRFIQGYNIKVYVRNHR